MADSLNWDEFRIIRAIAETHSLSGAAERLGLNHSTLFRRLAAMEARFGVKLFERERSGYRPTAAGDDMATLANLMGDTIAEFERRVTRNDVKLSGSVRLTTLHSLGVLVMPAIASSLLGAHPGLRLDLILTDTSLDVLGGEVDIALRMLKAPPSDSLTGRRIGPAPWAIYALPALAPTSEAYSDMANWVFPAETFGPPAARRWLARHVEAWRRAATANNDLLMAELAALGVGAALLPCYVGAAKRELRRVGKADPDIDRDLWLLAQPQALRTPRIRAAFDFVGDELDRRRAWFEGETYAGM
jgi:DNA-binding transcriptional LysR family regulator